MTPRMVSWKDNELVSPSSSSALSVVSIDSILRLSESDSHIVTPEALGERPAELRVKPKDSLGGAEPMTDGSFPRHDRYYFKDGNVTFLVGGTLYCVHRYFFCRDSVYFSTKFAQLCIPDHEPLSTIISLDDIERSDFDAFLSILYTTHFYFYDNLQYEQWRSVIHLSTRWGFATIRKLALELIELPNPHDQLLLARTYDVDHWVLPALSELCEREEPISVKEARQMSIEDVVLVATAREEVRIRKARFNTDDIPSRVKAIQARLLTHGAGGDDSENTAENEASKKPPKDAATAKVDGHDSTKEAAPARSTGKEVDKNGNDEHLNPKAGTSTGSHEKKIDPKHEQQQTPKITLKDNVVLSSVKPKKTKEQKKPAGYSDTEGCADHQRKKQKTEPGQDQEKSTSSASTSGNAKSTNASASSSTAAM